MLSKPGGPENLPRGRRERDDGGRGDRTYCRDLRSDSRRGRPAICAGADRQRDRRAALPRRDRQPLEAEALHQVSQIEPGIPWGRRRTLGAAGGRLVVRTCGRGLVELMVDRSECWQSENCLDELQDGNVVVKRGLEVASLRKWRDHPGWYTDTQPPGVELRRWLVVEETTRLVVGVD